MTAYVPPVHSEGIELILDANEGGPQDEWVGAVLASIGVEALRRYPDPSPLERQIAYSFGIGASRVVATNGGDDAIDRICRSVLQDGRVMITHEPSFEMIPRSARFADARVECVSWIDGLFPLDEMLEAVDSCTEGELGLVSLVSPNNPTGCVIESGVVRAIAQSAAARDGFVMLDQAYIEFADEDPLVSLINEPNVIAVRTMSKAFGLAGIRCGYAIAPEHVATWLRTVGGPYPLSSVSIALACEAVKRRDQRQRTIESTRRNRDRLTELLRERGLDPIGSQGNFVAARSTDASAIHTRLLELGVSVRSFVGSESKRSLLRITVPSDEQSMNRLALALTQATQDDKEQDT